MTFCLVPLIVDKIAHVEPLWILEKLPTFLHWHSLSNDLSWMTLEWEGVGLTNPKVKVKRV